MTLNSVRFYRNIYPNATVIVSTWDDESEEHIHQLVKFGATIVRSVKPTNNGFWNINYQLTSSLAGMQKAKELGCEFAVKTRTDQRICKPFIFDSMLATMSLFPTNSEKQKGRLVLLETRGGNMFIPYHCSDFLYLGYTEDLIRLFSAPLYARDKDDEVNLRKVMFSLTDVKSLFENFHLKSIF